MLDPDHLAEMTIIELLKTDAMVSFRSCGNRAEITEREDDIQKLRVEMTKRRLMGGVT